MIKLILIGSLLLNIDGHDVKQCQYLAPNSNNHIVLSTYTSPSLDCAQELQL